MPIEFKTDEIIFRDVASVEEAEPLLEWLQKTPGARITLTACTHLHTANLQVLMAARPKIATWPDSTELRAWLKTALGPTSGEPDGIDDSCSR